MFTTIFCRRSIRHVVLIFASQVPVATCLCQSPGGVSSGLDFWLKANANVYNNGGTTLATNGQTVQQWNTQSGTNHFTQATSGNRPTYRTSRINGYPTLDFTGDMFLSENCQYIESIARIACRVHCIAGYPGKNFRQTGILAD